MADYYQRFVIPDVPEVYALFVQSIRDARSRGLIRTAEYLTLLFGEYREAMIALSVRTSEIADAEIKAHIRSSAKRAVQTEPGGLIDQIQSEPIRADAGMVGVARLDGTPGLDNLAYWRAQEYGLDAGFVGRVIHGYFYDFGGSNPTEPEHGRGDQPFFAPDSGGGFGTIKNPIEARHFLSKGTDAALVYWRREQQRINVNFSARIDRALVGLRAVR